ncbi:MAG: hypothetical protein WC655_04425 [Candidatus Hydrogenedentales bacterium]|jgi:hypothetical protein
MMPAIAGKTVYQQSFEDLGESEISESGQIIPGQVTRYSLDIKAPAGVKLDDITGMTYAWDSFNGQIAINKSAQLDSSAQAQAMLQLNQQQMEVISSLSEALISAAAPLIGAKITADKETKAAEIASKTLLRQSLIEALRDPEVLGAIKEGLALPSKPKAPKAPETPDPLPAPEEVAPPVKP